MPESLDAVNAQDWNLVSITCEQLRVLLDINLFERVEFSAARLRDLLLHLVAETAISFCV